MNKIKTSSTKCYSSWILTLIISSATTIFGQTTIQVVWMVPFKSYHKNDFVYNASTSVAALALGIESAYNQSILPGYVFNVTAIDTKCESFIGIGALVDVLIQQKVDVVIGLPCSKLDSVAELLLYRGIPFFNWFSQETTYSSSSYTTYIRLYTVDLSVVWWTQMFLKIYTNWRRAAIVSTDSALYKEATRNLMKYLFGFVLFIYDDMHTNADAWQIDRTFKKITKEARIIVLIVPRNEMRKYMLRAHVLGMINRDFKFIFVDTMAEDKEFLEGDILWNTGDESDSAALEAFRNVIYLVGRIEFQNISIWGSAAFEAYHRLFSDRADIPVPTDLDRFSGLLHDVFILYVKALNKSLESGGNISVSEMVTNISFTGLSGEIKLYDLFGRLTEVGVYEIGDASEFKPMIYYFNKILDYPPDTPPCGFLNEKCRNIQISEEENSVSIVVSICMAAFLFLLVLAVIWRWQRERNLLNMTWKIEYTDLNFNRTFWKIHSSADFCDSNRSDNNTNHSRYLRSSALSVQSGKSSVGQSFTTVASFQREIVAVKYSALKRINVDRNFLHQMKCLNELKHDNLAKFVGVCLSPEKICSVWEYCKRGSMQDIIQDESIRLDAMFKISIAVDVCKGLEYIHNNKIIQCHGNLRSTNCVIDNRWVCKLTNYGIERILPTNKTQDSIGEHAFYSKLFWTAPEDLRKIIQKKEIKKNHRSDVYSLGVILMELACRTEPYSSYQDLSPKEIILRVANSTKDNIFRPIISDAMLDPECSGIGLVRLIKDCWTEDPQCRPAVKNVHKTLLRISPFKKICVVDNMILMMEKYTNDLENIVLERTQQLEDEKIKTETLLYRMLPKKIADDLKLGNTVQAEAYESVTIYFSDIVKFTNIASESTPLQIVCLLNTLYTLFDEIISNYDVYKVETIGDAYMIVSGLPEKNGNQHVLEIARVALKILASVLTFKIPHRKEEQLRIRIGLHTGPVVAGVVGLTMPRYCLFGDTVNTASRMESNGEPLRIHISPETEKALSYFPNFLIEERGYVPIKGKGLMHTFWLNGECEEHVN